MTLTRSYGRFVFTEPTDLMSFDSSSTVATGQRLRLYEAMVSLKTVTPVQLAMATGTAVWFIDSWLQAQSHAGYAVFDPMTERYSLFCQIPSTAL
jgi:hypothetical protein